MAQESTRVWQRPAFWSHFHLTRVVIWAALIPVALLTSLKDSVPFLVLVSLLAPLLSDLASWRVDKNEDDRDEPPTCDEIAAAVVSRLAEHGNP